MDDGIRPDFRQNDQWFDMKIITNGTLEGSTKGLSSPETYRRKLKRCFEDLGIRSMHLAHFPRVTAPAQLELAELSADEIRIFGEFFCGRN